jgi:hypothetical protein
MSIQEKYLKAVGFEPTPGYPDQNTHICKFYTT